MNCIRVFIWGTGYKYSQYSDRVMQAESNGEIEIVGITSNDKYLFSIGKIPFVTKQEFFLGKIEFDCILVMASESLQKEIYAEIGANIKIDTSKIHLINCHVLDIPGFTFGKYIKLLDAKPSIMAENCWGALTYNYLHMRFDSPLINLNLSNKDYFKLMKNPLKYMKEELIEIDKGLNKQENYWFPICSLGDLRINMIHYRSYEQALNKWNRRKERINWENIVAMTYTYE